MIIKLRALLIATRPPTLLAGIGPVILALALSYSHAGHVNSIIIAICTLLSTLFMQIGTNLVNDYYDNRDGVDNADRLGPQRVNSKTTLDLKEVKTFYRLSFIVSFLLGVYLMYQGGIVIIILGLLSLTAAFCYTGGPYPLSRNALGEVTAFIFFGPVAVCGTYYLQTSNIQFNTFIFSLIPGFIAAAIMSINNLRDRQSDSKVNKKTLATLMSENGAKLLPSFFIILAQIPALYMYIQTYSNLYLIALFFPLVFSRNWFSISFKDISEHLNFNLKITGLYLFLSCLLNSYILCL